jgi:hypothetical protein
MKYINVFLRVFSGGVVIFSIIAGVKIALENIQPYIVRLAMDLINSIGQIPEWEQVTIIIIAASLSLALLITFLYWMGEMESHDARS